MFSFNLLELLTHGAALLCVSQTTVLAAISQVLPFAIPSHNFSIYGLLAYQLPEYGIF